MIICYIDESGTPEIPGTTNHYILAGIALPIEQWKDCDQEIRKLKETWNLSGREIHTAWMLRRYIEQSRIPNFEHLNFEERKREIKRYRTNEIYRLQRANNPSLLKRTKKTYQKTEKYTHLTFDERKNIVFQLADTIANWQDARLFAEAIDKLFFDPSWPPDREPPEEQAFMQVVTRFNKYLKNKSSPSSQVFGLLVHDNNETVAKKLTSLMKIFHSRGTLWTDKIKNIVETPLFVDSQLTGMVQMADLCSYALRRYFENNEEALFNKIFQRADSYRGKVVGVRHYTYSDCSCKICNSRR